MVHVCTHEWAQYMHSYTLYTSIRGAIRNVTYARACFCVLMSNRHYCARKFASLEQEAVENKQLTITKEAADLLIKVLYFILFYLDFD